MYEIYKITLPDGRSYYGQHNQTVRTGKTYRGIYMGSGTILRRYYQKHGFEGVKKDILYLVNTKKEADILEKQVIAKNRDLFCINIADGGEGWSGKHGKMDKKSRRFYEIMTGQHIASLKKEMAKLLSNEDMVYIITGNEKVMKAIGVDKPEYIFVNNATIQENLPEIEDLGKRIIKMFALINNGKKRTYIIKGKRKIA